MMLRSRPRRSISAFNRSASLGLCGVSIKTTPSEVVTTPWLAPFSPVSTSTLVVSCFMHHLLCLLPASTRSTASNRLAKKSTECFESLLCGCQQPRPKRDCLLFVARHTAVTLTWDASLSFRTRPRDLCLKRRTIKSLSLRFWLSSSRSLGRCLLLGQRSPMNLHTVRPYIHHTSLSRDGKSSKTSPFVLSTVEGLRRSFSRIMLRRPGLV